MSRLLHALRNAFSARSFSYGFAALAMPAALFLSHHQWHVLHEDHLAHVAAERSYAQQPVQHASGYREVSYTAPASYSGGVMSAGQVGQLWVEAGGPSWAEGQAEQIAYCESGYNPDAYNPSGASGIWQILGSVVPGDLFNPWVNAENAVAKFRGAGDSFAPWVCQ